MQFFFIVAAFIVISVISARVKAEKEAAAKRAKAPAQQPSLENTPVLRSPAGQTATAAPQSQRPGAARAPQPNTGEIAREARELARQAREFASAVTGRQAEPKPAPAARPSSVKPAARPDRRPLVPDDDCGGGSIHDGYHEGASTDPFGEHKGTAVAGNLGKKLGATGKLPAEADAAQNARRALARISKLPPITQGIVYSEILGKPRSETA